MGDMFTNKGGSNFFLALYYYSGPFTLCVSSRFVRSSSAASSAASFCACLPVASCFTFCTTSRVSHYTHARKTRRCLTHVSLSLSLYLFFPLSLALTIGPEISITLLLLLFCVVFLRLDPLYSTRRLPRTDGACRSWASTSPHGSPQRVQY